MTSNLEELATEQGVLAYLQNKPEFAAHRVDKFLGGMGNYTFRIYLQRPFDGHQTLVLKYSPIIPPYATSSFGKNIPPSGQDRPGQLREAYALRCAAQQLGTASDIPAFIKVPTIHLFDKESGVIIMDDAGEGSRTLKQLLIEESIPKDVAEQIGAGLGKFIYTVHSWIQVPDLDVSFFANNQRGKLVGNLVTYGLLESTLTGKDNIPTLSDPLLGIPQAKLKTISKLAEKRQQDVYATSTSDVTRHGDFWPGNVAVTLKRSPDGTVEGVESIYVLDWEGVKTGLAGLDLGQFCAEMYTLSEFFPARERSTQAIIWSLLSAYKERRGAGEDVELARTTVSHIGAHVVALTPRISTWTGREKTREVVKKGVEMLVMGEEGPESLLRSSIVAPLL